jgi:hypothetical protein
MARRAPTRSGNAGSSGVQAVARWSFVQSVRQWRRLDRERSRLVRTAGVEPAQPCGRGILSRLSSLILLKWDWVDFVNRRVVWPDSKTGEISKPTSGDVLLLLSNAPRPKARLRLCPLSSSQSDRCHRIPKQPSLCLDRNRRWPPRAKLQRLPPVRSARISLLRKSLATTDNIEGLPGVSAAQTPMAPPPKASPIPSITPALGGC